MPKTEEILIPDIGDFDAVEIVEVLVNPGDMVEVEDPLITLESDKATMEVPSLLAGKVVEVKVKIGDKVGEGAVVLVLEIDEAKAVGEESEPAPEKSKQEVPLAPPLDEEPPASEAMAPTPPAPAAPAPRSDLSLAPVDEFPHTTTYASPAVRRFARELGVGLARVKGTGRKGRVLREDVQGFVKKTLSQPQGQGAAGLPEMPVIDFSRFGEVEREPLTRIQMISKTNVHRSWLHVPHVTQHDEADVTEMEAFRKAHADDAKAKGFKLTPVAFLLKAAAAALAAFPEVNASLDPSAENLIVKKYFHIGVAVDTPNGLVVPVVRDVDRKGLFELAEELLATSSRARDGKLTPSDFQGASFTISSLGGIGGTAFTPIVNAPEVAILGVSRSRMKPVWQGGEFVPRLMLPLSLSYDHRVIDGAMAARFVVHLSSLLGDLRRLLL